MRVALLIVGLLAQASTAAEEPIRLNEDLRVERISDGLWRHVSYYELERFGRSAANGLIVVSGKSAALIDTPWTESQTRELIDWISKSLGATVDVVVATHSHPDCAGGLAIAHERGAVSYASAKTAEFARRDGNAVPRKTFTDTLDVEVGSRTLTLEFAGPGHSVDNIVVWIPDESVLFGGCLVKSATSKHLGYTDEADLASWPATIELVRQRYESLQLVVPGHGSPGGMELFERTLELLAGDQVGPQ